MSAAELRELYQEFILDHGKNPRNFCFPDQTNREAEGYNPLCGDRLTVKLELDGERIQAIGFQGHGCAISVAAASTMTEAVVGKTVAEVASLMEAYLRAVKGEEVDLDQLDKLAVFQGVSEFPMRVKCATLAWHTLQAALEQKNEAVTTE